MKHLSQKTRAALFWSTGGTLLSNFIQVGVVAILARLLSPADFGVYAAALVFILALGFAPLAAPRPRRAVWLRPPLRGPPLTA